MNDPTRGLQLPIDWYPLADGSITTDGGGALPILAWISRRRDQNCIVSINLA